MARHDPPPAGPLLAQYGVDTIHLLLDDTPRPLWYVHVAGNQAIACWQTLRDHVDTTGHWPVLLGDDEAFKRVLEHLRPHYSRHVSVERILADAAAIDVGAWLEEARRAQDSEDGPWDTTEGEMALRGPWPDDLPPNTTLVVPYDYRTHEPYSRIALGLLPTTHSWEAPAYLRFGDFNSCHSPAEHTRVLQRWHARYGAEVASVTHDVIEMVVARPPAGRDAALALAYEQFVYCWDIVDQGVGTLDALAASLLNGTTWYFWWD